MELNTDKIYYYYGNDIRDALKIKLDTVIEFERIFYTVKFVFDTGAMSVLLNSRYLSIMESESDFAKKHNLKPINHFGIDSSRPITYYRCIVDSVRLGPFILKEFPIHITFDARAPINLLGMPILRLFEHNIKPQYKKIEIKEIEEFREYTSGKKSCKNIDRDPSLFETYIDLTHMISNDIEANDIEANYINRLVQENK